MTIKQDKKNPFLFSKETEWGLGWYYQDAELSMHGPYFSRERAEQKLEAQEIKAPRVSMYLDEDSATAKAHNAGAHGAPIQVKLLRGAKTIAKRVKRADFVAGETKRRCPTCGRWMFIKHFQKHAIEGKCKGAKNVATNSL
jgi:hypothetical protein